MTPELRLEVSRRIREDFANGRYYYQLHGSDVRSPQPALRSPLERGLALAQRGGVSRVAVTVRHASDATTAIQVLKDRVRRFCEERDWDPFHSPKELAIGIVTEAAELLEHFRFQTDEEVEALLSDPKSRVEIESEVADVLIFVLRLAQKYEIDLSRAVEAKLQSNEKRYPVEAARGSNRKARK